VDEGAAEGELLLHAVAVLAHELAGLVRELEHREQLVGPTSRLAAVEPVELAVDPELLRAGEPLEQREAVRHDADVPLHGERIALEVDPEHARAPRGGGEQAREHLDGRALPGAVRPEEPVERTSRHGEREPLHGGAPVEQPREPLRLDRERHVPSSTAGTLLGRVCGSLQVGVDRVVLEVQELHAHAAQR
jgi:hypothetical protein